MIMRNTNERNREKDDQAEFKNEEDKKCETAKKRKRLKNLNKRKRTKVKNELKI